MKRGRSFEVKSMRPVYVIAGCEGEMRWVLLKSQVQVGEEAWVMESGVLLSGWA